MLRDSIRMPYELVVKICGDIPDKRYGNANDGQCLKWRERSEQSHWAESQMSKGYGRHTIFSPRRLHDFVAHEEELRNDT